VSARSAGFELQDLFQNLPLDYRATLFLVDVEELSYADAARVLEVPIETIRLRVSHGRALMRNTLQHSPTRARESK
jgi:RNA polymerase sigma-70 factor (ECF subfamily)